MCIRDRPTAVEPSAVGGLNEVVIGYSPMRACRYVEAALREAHEKT